MTRIGIVGVGTYGTNHFEALMDRERTIHDVEIVGFAEIDAARRIEVERLYGKKGYPDHLAMIESVRPDAITVATPDHLHSRIVDDCLSVGLPVLVEKPFTTNIEEAENLARKARAKGILVQVDFHKRFDPYHIDLKLRIEAGELGEVQYGHCWMEDILRVGTDMIGKAAWQSNGSPAWFLGIHMIDLSYWLMGCPKPRQVFAHGFKGKLRSCGIDIYDSITAQVVYANNAVITYDMSAILPNNHEAVVRQGVKMVGTEGFVEVDSQYRGARGCTTANGMFTPNLGMSHRIKTKDGRIIRHGYFSDSICDFVENLNYLHEGHTLTELEGKYASPEQGIETTKIGVAIHESARLGKPIDLE